MCEAHCVMPPAPELMKRIVQAKRRLVGGVDVQQAAGESGIDPRALTLILSRPTKTRGHTFATQRRAPAPILGQRDVLVLLVDFSDAAATRTQAHYTDLLFSRGTRDSGSMRDFFHEASYAQLDVTGSVNGSGGPTAGWFRAPQPKAHYTDANYGFGTYPKNAQKLVEDVIDLARPSIDFSQFDSDNDGHLDALVIICAGTGAEATGDVNDLWSHKWGIAPQVINGVTVDSYFMAPEDGRVGVMAHELGHLLMGWPDLYDTDYSSAGTGNWDLMASGSWNGQGDTPAHPCAWCKAAAGWVTPATIQGQQSVSLAPFQSNADVLRLPVTGSSSEYFLLSNRQKAGFDALIPGGGLIIEHVDENQLSNADENHYLVDIEQCDGQQHLNKNQNQGDGADPFPCSGNSQFTADSTPASTTYAGADSLVSVTNIARAGDTITADVSVGGVVAQEGEVWHDNKAVVATWAHHSAGWAWANIEDLGWRRVRNEALDAVGNMFQACCHAATTGRNVSVLADDELIHEVYLFATGGEPAVSGKIPDMPVADSSGSAGPPPPSPSELADIEARAGGSQVAAAPQPNRSSS